MRSGPPDSLDLMVAVNFAHMALSLALDRSHSQMVALRQGTYTHVPLGVLSEGGEARGRGGTLRRGRPTAPRSAT